MHVVILSDSETRGGAGVAASRLAEAWHSAGHRVTRIVHRAENQERPWRTLSPNSVSPLLRAGRKMLPSWARKAWARRVTHSRLDRLLDELCPDVINVHNLHGWGAIRAGWSPDLLRICADHAPTVWTLHDMWSFTGRCAYSYDCRKFLSGCDATCPTPTEHPSLPPGQIAAAWKRRQRLFSACDRLVAVAPSRWMAREAQAGLWAGHRVEVIPNGLPLNIYRPLDRATARDSLGINARGPVLLAAADDLSERRKGMSFLLQALQNVNLPPLTVVTMGAGSFPSTAQGISFFHLGYVQDEHRKVLAYSAADMLVHPAPVDNLPLVVIESIACGTPVVAFDIGGLSDLVRPGKTGWLAPELLPQSLASALKEAVNDSNRALTLRSTCRSVAEAEFSVSLQAERYVDLYRSLN